MPFLEHQWVKSTLRVFSMSSSYRHMSMYSTDGHQSTRWKVAKIEHDGCRAWWVKE